MEFKHLLVMLLCTKPFAFCVGIGNIPNGEDEIKFLTKYTSMMEKNLNTHVNVTESYLEENSDFVKYATSALNSLTKSVKVLSRNIGLGDVPNEDFRESLTNLMRQVKDISSEQRRQREATSLLSMKIDLVLQTLISKRDHKEISNKEVDSGSGKMDPRIDNILLGQKAGVTAIENLKEDIATQLNRRNEPITQISNDFASYQAKLVKDKEDLQANLKHIKDITNENFMILRNQLKKQTECAPPAPMPKIFHKVEDPSVSDVIVEGDKVPSTTPAPAPGEERPPKIESATSFINIDLLKDFEAKVLITGVPRPVVTWSKGLTCSGNPNETITSGGRYAITLDDMAPGLYAAKLKISTFRHDDGEPCYFLTANNSAGTVSTTVILAPKTQVQDCPGSYQKVQNLCLDLITLWSPWEVSKSECQALGGNLIQPTFPQMFKILDSWPAIKAAEKDQKFWIGGKRSHENDWRSINGSLITVPEDAWAVNEPNESGNCLMIDIGTTEWRVWDAPCNSQRQAICQME